MDRTLMPIEKCRKVIFHRSFTAALLIVLVGGLIASLSSCGGGGGSGGGSAGNPPGGGSGADTAAVDAKAVRMAADILKGGDQTEPALQKALLDAGFSIQEIDGTTTMPTSSDSLGMLFSRWDLDAMAAGITNGGVVTLADYTAAVQLVFLDPALGQVNLDAAQITTDMLADLRNSATSGVSATRKWARLIVELGRQSDASYDLMDPNIDSSVVELNSVQLNLWTQMFAGDIVSSSTAAPTSAAQAKIARVAHDTAPAAPCTLTDTQQMIMDQAARTATTGFKETTKYLNDHGVAGAGTLSKASKGANMALVYAKLLASLLAFKMDFKADLTELVRTLSTVNGGQQMHITATVAFDNGNLQLLNCARIVGNLVGVDLKLNATGPIKNAEINWYILQGETQGSAGQLGYIRWAAGNLPNVARSTDANGQDTITVEGAPQPKHIVDPHSVEKPGKVHAKISLVKADIVKDVINQIPSGSNPWGLGASLPAEMILRTGLLFERSYSFTVVDWEECGDTSSGKPSKALQAANVCNNTWTGTASFTMGADPATSPTTSANVTWVFDRIDGDVVHYKPTGTASYAFPTCSVVPSSETMSTQPGGGTGGELAIDFSVDPPTYKVQGSTVWAASYCGGPPIPGAGGAWVGDPNNISLPVSGTVTVDNNTHKLTLSGAAAGLAGSTTWSFTKD